MLGSVDGLRDDDRIRERRRRAPSTAAIYPDGTARQLAAILASPDRTPGAARARGADRRDPRRRSIRLIGVSGGEATAAAIPGAELVIIEDMGHDLPPGVWDRIVDALTRNFERATERAAS